jgi:hypothetical protein
MCAALSRANRAGGDFSTPSMQQRQQKSSSRPRMEQIGGWWINSGPVIVIVVVMKIAFFRRVRRVAPKPLPFSPVPPPATNTALPAFYSPPRLGCCSFVAFQQRRRRRAHLHLCNLNRMLQYRRAYNASLARLLCTNARLCILIRCRRLAHFESEWVMCMWKSSAARAWYVCAASTCYVKKKNRLL